MAETDVYDLEGKADGKISLPDVFQTTIRLDIIKKAVIIQQSHLLQPQGRDLMAGKRTSAVGKGTGLHLSRVPRVKGSGYSKSGQGAFAPSTVGGRTTHPPKSEKRIYKRINKKERLLAIRSAIAATADKTLVSSRGHIVDNIPSLPLVVKDTFQEISKADEAKAVFEKLGLFSDLMRVERSVKIRAGKGVGRGRRWRHSVGPLFVIDVDKGIGKAMRNFLGVDVVEVNRLNTELLAPGANAGRLTVWTSSAITKLEPNLCR